MLPKEICPLPSLGKDARIPSYGFSSQVSESRALDLLSDDLIKHLEATAASNPSRTFVMDLSNVGGFSSAALVKMIQLQKTLSRANWKMILVSDNGTVHEAFRVTQLNGNLRLVTREELSGLNLQGSTPVPGHPGNDGSFADFTAEEISQILAAGITLDQVIDEIDRLAR